MKLPALLVRRLLRFTALPAIALAFGDVPSGGTPPLGTTTPTPPQSDAATPAATPAAGPAVLTTVREILQLGREGARLRQPRARLRAFVTLAGPTLGPRFYLQDATGALRANLDAGVAPPDAGREIDAEGHLIGGLFAPFLVVTKWRLIGPGTAPAPRLVKDVPLGIDCDDGAWAVIRGYVRNASIDWGELRLEVASDGRTWDARIASPGFLAVPEVLMDAEVEVQGAALLTRDGPLAPSGVALIAWSPEFFKLLKPGPLDRFAGPLMDLGMVPSHAPNDGTRVRVRGTVTLASPADRLGLTDSTGSLEVRLLPIVKGDPGGRYIDRPTIESVHVGDVVEVLGAPATEDGFFFLGGAEFRRVGPGTPPVPVRVDLETASSGKMNGSLVTLRGEVVSLPTPSLVHGVTVEPLLLRQGDTVFEAVWETRRAVSWKPTLHSWVAVTGTCTAITRPGGSRAVRINLRGPDDVQAVAAPSFWQRPETVRTLAWVGLAVTVTGAWILLLRRLVRRRTRELNTAVNQLSSEITEKRHIEQQLRDSLAKEREVGEMKSNFVNLVSHEFRTPLGIIMSSAGILENYLDRLTVEKRRECLLDIHRATRLMSGLVEDVLHLGKLSADKADCLTEPVHLGALCEEFADEVLSSTYARCPIEVTTGDLDEPALVDEHLLRSVVTNLLSNAVKYSPPGSPVHFRIERRAGEAVLTITDFGIGIAPDDQARLFEAFHRGGNVGDQTGSGLGLAIVKRCTELHGGRLDIQSQLHHGTTVTVCLPCFEPLVQP